MPSSSILRVVRAGSAFRDFERLSALVAVVLTGLIATAFLRHLVGTHPASRQIIDAWVVLHLCVVLPALPLGILIMGRRKGDRSHRLLGRIWAVLMLLAAASGLKIGLHWSPIHILSVFTLVTVPLSVAAAIRGDISRHRRGMSLLFLGLVIAGFFTLLPTRLLGGWLAGRN